MTAATHARPDDAIVITEVAPRDGLQNEPVAFPLDAKVALVERLTQAGLRSIEVASLVSPRAVPRMADSEALLARLARRQGIRHSVLVPNRKGLERAMAAGVEEIAVVLAATETMNRKNINMSLAQASDACIDMLQAAQASGMATRAYIAVAVECPFEGLVAPGVVAALSARMAAAGAREIVIADTIGAAAPGQIRSVLGSVASTVPLDRLAVHLHDTRGMGLANAWEALQCGIRRFDSSAGGIGGCPFAPGAAGNLATEDLVLMLHQCGMQTGVDLARLHDAIDFAGLVLGRQVGGHSSAWHRRKRNTAAPPIGEQAGIAP